MLRTPHPLPEAGSPAGLPSPLSACPGQEGAGCCCATRSRRVPPLGLRHPRSRMSAPQRVPPQPWKPSEMHLSAPGGAKGRSGKKLGREGGPIPHRPPGELGPPSAARDGPCAASQPGPHRAQPPPRPPPRALPWASTCAHSPRRLPLRSPALLWSVSHFLLPLRARESLIPHLSLPASPPVWTRAGWDGAQGPHSEGSPGLASAQRLAGRGALRPHRPPEPQE